MKLSIHHNGDEDTVELSDETARMLETVLTELNGQLEDEHVTAAEFVKEPVLQKILAEYQTAVKNREGVGPASQ